MGFYRVLPGFSGSERIFSGFHLFSTTLKLILLFHAMFQRTSADEAAARRRRRRHRRRRPPGTRQIAGTTARPSSTPWPLPRHWVRGTLKFKKKGTKSSRESLVEERETGTDGEHRKGLTRGSFRPGTCPVTPQTSTGKWLTMAYAAVGMPLLLLYLSVAGASLSSCLCLGLRRSKRLQLVQT